MYAGGPGGPVPPHFLTDLLTLSQPGGPHYPHPVLCALPDFQTLRRPCNVFKNEISFTESCNMTQKCLAIQYCPKLYDEMVALEEAGSIITVTGKSLSEALLFAEHGEKMLCKKIVPNARNNFCTQHVLPRFELGIFMY